MYSMGLASLPGDYEINYRKSIPICQDFALCGLEKETCVAKQTLKDTKCLVPCDGLYADIADNYDTTIQNMKKGAQSFATSYFSKSTGFQIISQEWGTKHVEDVLQRMFPNASEEEETDHLNTLTAAYKKYKMEYVKQLRFNPEEELLSKKLFDYFQFLFSATVIEHIF